MTVKEVGQETFSHTHKKRLNKKRKIQMINISYNNENIDPQNLIWSLTV